jgi:predicted DNA-binding transcriptional regulator AlpA
MTLMETSNTTSAPSTPLLIGAAAVGALLSVSKRQVWNMHQTGALGPLPVKLGGRTLWRTADIEAWVKLKCPNRERWMDLQESN